MELSLDQPTRAALWRELTAEIERYRQGVSGARVAPLPSSPAHTAAELRAELARFDFESPTLPREALTAAVRGLWSGQVHTPHPRYFGLFNPAPTAMGIAADALVAAFNPQIAAWSHNPFAAEIERHLIQAFAGRLGYPSHARDGVFTSGGAEANHTALACALVARLPEFSERGLRHVTGQPTIYVSGQSHDSVVKAARLCGLGTEAVRALPVGGDLRLSASTVADAIARDRASGCIPLLLVATAGTTSAGVIDPLPELAGLAHAERLWFHVDAAWGGFAALVPELAPVLAGIERADSITFDAHKALSVPMGAGMFLTRHVHILDRTFRVRADYMPAGEGMSDPYAHSMQWSRRFIGLKLFLSLAVAGWQGYAAALRHQVAMGRLLREEAAADGWALVNDTPLPLVLLSDHGSDMAAVAQAIVASGEAWVSAVHLPDASTALRACVTNYGTGPDDIKALVASLRRHRRPRPHAAPR